jgi:hypothetical protein
MRHLKRRREQSKRMRYFEKDIEKPEIRMKDFQMEREGNKLEIMRTDFEREGREKLRRLSGR